MAVVRRMVGIAIVIVLVLAIFGGGWLIGRLGIGAVVDPSSLNESERQFVERMRDVSLVEARTVRVSEWQFRERDTIGSSIQMRVRRHRNGVDKRHDFPFWSPDGGDIAI